MERLRNMVVLLRGQLWILPTGMSIAGLALAYGLLQWPPAWERIGGSKFWWLYSGDAGSARDLLGALLSGTITMTSLVVSLTFVTLTLAANQLGPRLILNFIGDRQIQAVLGLFLATIFYVLVVLRSLNDTLGEGGVPHLAITAASLLMVLSLFALLFYVHKIARSIMADTVVDRVSRDLEGAIRDLMAERTEARAELVVEELPRPSQSIAFNRSGYIQTIDYGSLVSCAKDADVVLEIPVRAGHFAVRRGICAKVLTDGSLPEDAAKQIRHAFVIGSERSPAQDLEFSIRQLVEIALRALSPGINDPFTAIAVVDRLAAALEDVFSRDIQPRLLFDEQSCLRVVADRSDVEGLVSACFDQLRQAAIRNPGVLIHLADTLGKIAPLAEGEAASRAILSQLKRLHESVGKTELGDTDRQILSQRIEKARSALSRS